MQHFLNNDIEYVIDDYYDMINFDGEPFSEGSPPKRSIDDPFDSDFEDDFDMGKSKTDTSAVEARNGKDMQGIPWERLNFTRGMYREARLKQYKNYENLSSCHEELEKVTSVCFCHSPASVKSKKPYGLACYCRDLWFATSWDCLGLIPSIRGQ